MTRNDTRRRRRPATGFTLLEVLLVLVILVVLGSMAALGISGQQNRALKNSAKAQVRLFDRAIETYHFNMKSYPDSLDDLVEKPSDAKKADNWDGPYLNKKKVPLDPWDNDYRYKKDGESYRVWSTGPDGQDGSDDDIASDDE